MRVTETNTITGCSITTPDLVVQIEDLLAPVISGCPSDINANTDAGLCTAVVTWTVKELLFMIPGLMHQVVHSLQALQP